MSRWLVAVVLVAGMLVVGALAFLNADTVVAVRVTTGRTLTLPLGTAIAIAFGSGTALAGVLALAGATARAWRAWRVRRTAARTAARLRRERITAETLLARGDADAARARLAAAVATHGPDDALLDLLAGASERSGDVAGAIAAVEEARRLGPHRPLLARRLVSLYADAGRWEDALAVETEVLLELRSPPALAAETTRLCGLRYEAALADPDPARGLRRLWALSREHPAFVPAWVALGDRLREAGRVLGARRAYERGARARPAPILLDRLAALHAETGRPDRARKAFARIAARHPNDPGLLAHLVRLRLRDGALDEADALLARWPAEGRQVPAIEALRGELYRRRDAPAESLVHFARAAADLVAPSDAHRCGACGSPTTGWHARCTHCGRWDTIAPDGAPSADLIPPGSRSPSDDHCAEPEPG